MQKFDVPVEATTPSLEALKAYSMAITTSRTKGDAEAIPFMKRAIELDPNFAIAYEGLAIEYGNMGQATLAAENGKKAYDLRDRVSERERSHYAYYFNDVLGEVEQGAEAYELWAKSYPRDAVPPGNLAVDYWMLGQFDKAITKAEATQRIAPSIVSYGNLGACSVCRWIKDARDILAEAQQKGFDGLIIRSDLYNLAFLAGDNAEMERQVAWAAGRPVRRTKCSPPTLIPRSTMDAWKKRATSPGAPSTRRCVRIPKRSALRISPFRRCVRLRSVMMQRRNRPPREVWL